MIEEIRQKIINGYYQENPISSEDFVYIINDESLLNELAYYLTQHKFFLKIPKNDSFCNAFELGDKLLAADIELSEEQKYNLYYNLILIEEYELSVVLDMDSIDHLDIKEEYKEKLKNELEEFYLTTNEDFVFSMDDVTINRLLDLRRYDLIKKVNPYNYQGYIELSDSTIERLNKEFPLDQFGDKPNIIFLENEKYDLSNFNPEDVFDFFDNNRYPEWKERNFFKKYFTEFIKKISQTENNNYSYSFNHKLFLLLDHCWTLAERVQMFDSEDDFNNILLDFVKNGYYSPSLGRALLLRNLMTQEEIDELFFKQLEKTDEPYNLIADNHNKLTSFRKKLIDKGYGLYLYLNQHLIDLNHHLTPEELNLIKENIKKGNNKITKVEIRSITSLFEDEELANYILDNCKITFINLGYFIDAKYKNNQKFILLKQSILKNKTDFDNLRIFDKELIELLKEKGYYSSINQVRKETNGYYDDEKNMDNWILDNINDVLLLQSLISSSTNIYLLKKLLKNSLFIDQIIDKIKHNELLTSQMDKELFDLVKDYYSKKYNCNVDNMDYLCNCFGPQIIFYLENESVIDLINLDRSDIEKIVNLFPMDRTLVEVEATNESLLQYSYKEDETKKTVIELFTNFKISCSQQDKKQIEIEKFLLMSLVDISFFDKFKKSKDNPKYIDLNHPEYKAEYKGISKVLEQIENMSLETAIDFLISKFEIDEYREVLKLLCDNAVCNDRRIYTSTIYYKETYDYRFSNISHFQNFMIFREKYPEEYDTIENREYNIKRLFGCLSKEYIKGMLIKYNYNSLEEFINYLVNNYSTSPKVPFIIDEAFNNAIVYAKSISKEDTSIFASLKIPYELEGKSTKNEVEKYLIRNCRNIWVHKQGHNSLRGLILNEMVNQGVDGSLALETIEYYSGDLETASDEVKKNVGLLFKVATKIIRELDEYDFDFTNSICNNFHDVIKRLDNEDKIKRVYNPSDIDVDIFPILSNLDIKSIKENILNNEKNYLKLLDIMYKTKPHLLEPEFLNFIEKNELPITDDLSDLAYFISYFGDIMEKELKDKDDFSYKISDVLNQSGVYAIIGSPYYLALGEDAQLIKKNPKPNPAYTKTKKNQRLKEAVDYTIKCFKRDEVLIPSFDEVYELEDNKKIECIVANFTAPCNLTHGERTGACMRIGGAGEQLFDFCINNKAGFHIRFENPETHEYVSRVSGFRNGNSVFLNQLRESKVNDYSSEDLYKSTKWIAEQLIELTKNTDNPIENVFVTTDYAISDIKVEKIELNGKKVKEGLGSVYTDYDTSSATVLATTAEKDYKPIRTGNKNIKPFKPVRSKPRESKKIKEATSRVNRVKAMNQLFSGVELSDIVGDDFKNGIIYIMSTDDWYIYVTENLQIVSEYLATSEEARIECDLYKGIITQQIQLGKIKEVNYAY